MTLDPPFFAFVSIIKKLTIPCNKNGNFHMVPPIKKPKKIYCCTFYIENQENVKIFRGDSPPEPPMTFSKNVIRDPSYIGKMFVYFFSCRFRHPYISSDPPLFRFRYVKCSQDLTVVLPKES